MIVFRGCHNEEEGVGGQGRDVKSRLTRVKRGFQRRQFLCWVLKGSRRKISRDKGRGRMALLINHKFSITGWKLQSKKYKRWHYKYWENKIMELSAKDFGLDHEIMMIPKHLWVKGDSKDTLEEYGVKRHCPTNTLLMFSSQRISKSVKKCQVTI
jgi:hypothetical protein